MKNYILNILSCLRRHNAFVRALSFGLCLVMVFYVIPSTIYAKAAELGGDNSESIVPHSDTAASSEPSVIDPFEVVELREETAKHFRLSDGSYVAAQYNYPVHSLDENGEWQDIDNVLTKNGSEFTNESARIKFAKKINGSSTLFALHDGNNKITLNLIGAEKGTKGEVTNRTDAEEDTELQKMMNLEKLSSSIIYRDILDGVDIEYVAYSMNVKENIIVKEKKSSYTYSFELKLNGLTPALTESGDIELSDDDTGEIRYVIPAPVVYDASGVYAPAEASAYTLTHENGKKYVLTIAADSAWMNAEERAFPVVIDPAVNKAGTAATVIDVNINSANPDMQTNNNHELTVMDNSRKMLIHWKTTSLPHVPSSARITEVYVSLRLISGYGAYVGAYEVTTDWDSTLTWNKYKYDHYGASEINLLDYHQMSFSSPYQSWNITEVAKKWYADSADNYGIAFANMSMNTSNATFCSAESDFMPGVTVIYRDMKGLESYWPYSSHSAGTAGDGHVNLANGNLVFTIPTLTATDNIFSYTPYLTYDSNMSNNPYWYVNANVALGTYSVATGFKLSVNETIMSVPLQNGSVNEYYYVYSDADGTEHFFYDQNDGTYRDEDGLGLVMTVESNGDILLVNEAKEIRYFDSVNMLSSSYCWRLTYIEDINGNRLLFTYAASHKPTKISLLPNGHSTPIDLLEFVYHQSTGALLMVYNATAKTATVFRYSYNYNSDIIQNGYRYLRQIDYAVGNTDATSNDFYNFALNAVSDTNIEVYDSASYNYNSSGKLTEVINTKSNTSIKYEWNGKYVKKISEYAADTLGNEISFTYHTDSTDVYSNGNDGRLGTTDDIKNSYVIDSYGRCTSAYSSSRDGTAIYGASGYIYDTQENSKNSIKQSSILGGHSTNYIINGSFEDITGTSPSHWSLNGNAYSTTISGVNGTFERSVTMRSTENYNSCISQKLMLSPDTYTLSFPMYVIRGEGMSGKIVIEDYNTHEVIYTEAITPIPHSGEGFFSSTFTIPYTSNQRSVILTIIFYAPSDSDDVHIVEIDSVMLSRSIGTSDYNFIEYGSFEYSLIGNDGNNATISTDYWVDESGNAASIGYTDSTDDKVATIHNSSGGDRYIKQTVYQASSSKLEEYMNSDPAELDKAHHVFSVSGFASASNIAYGMPASLKVVISYYKGAGNTDIEDTYVFHFSPDIDDWQFVSGNVILGYTQDGCPIEDYLGIKSITVYCDCFSNYKASASFNNISMTYVGINAVTNYTYTDDGRIESVVNGKNGQFYKYNDNGNVIATANNNGILVEYVYDINNVNRIKEIVEYSFTFNGESEFPYSYTSDPFAMVTKVLKYKTVYEYDNYGFVTSETIYAPDGNVNISSLSVYTKIGRAHV